MIKGELSFSTRDTWIGIGMLVDSHAHLDMEHFDFDREKVIERAKAAAVKQVITIGIDVKSSLNAIELTRKFPSVFACVGVHPHNADKADKDDLRRIALMLAEKKVVAVGEIGLDFYRNRSSRQQQVAIFKHQLDIAMSFDFPVVIHDREAHQEVLKVLSSFKKNGSKGVIHCFSGNYILAETFIDMGYHISIPGIITYKNAVLMHEVAMKIPLHRMLLETDAPFLSPVPYRGRRNEPCRLVYTAQKVAALRGMTFEEVARQTSENASRLFSIPLLK